MEGTKRKGSREIRMTFFFFNANRFSSLILVDDVGGGRIHFLFALAASSPTTHPFRDGASFLLFREAPTTFGALMTFVPNITQSLLHISSPSCFAVCDQHPSPIIV